jgi:hydroxymethylbilane synthase
MTRRVLRIGSRGSELALWQAQWVKNELARLHPRLETTLEIIKTAGDRILDSPLSKIGDKGLFTREIEHALLSGEIDLAVHSLKDLPTELPAGLTLGAIAKREDVRDVFIPHPQNPVTTLLDQPQDAKIATGSLRRQCQLLNLRPDFRIVDIRGNLGTRLKKLTDSDWSGMLLARAGVMRLGWADKIGETIEPDVILPAVGQGALAVEIREDDSETAHLIERTHSWETATAVTAERSLLRTLQGGCQIPIGAYGNVDRTADGNYRLFLNALVGSLDGTTVVRGKIVGDPHDAGDVGRRLANTLLAGGADRILREVRTGEPSE